MRLFVVQFVLAAVSDSPGMVSLRAAHVANAALVLAISVYVALQATRLYRLP